VDLQRRFGTIKTRFGVGRETLRYLSVARRGVREPRETNHQGFRDQLLEGLDGQYAILASTNQQLRA
jgi:hypothetical protein